MPIRSENPWTIDQAGTEIRVELIAESRDITWLLRVRAWPDNNVAVRAAADRRLRKLQRERVVS
jgi:hypothetical protein